MENKTNFIEVKVFKGVEEETAEIDTISFNKCKFRGELIESGDKTSDFCRMLEIEKKMHGFKFKTCINCFFFHYFCKDCKMFAAKNYCMPRLHITNQINSEMHDFLEKTRIDFNSKVVNYFHLRRKMVNGELQGDMEKKFVKGIEYCGNFVYIPQEEKQKLWDDTSAYIQKTNELTANEEKWYLVEQKKKYLEEVKKLKKLMKNEK